ncbi:uncharacterized protein [Blastocystis hominis]|uniref:MHD domain-containing protein n=1 Tax=Blastocystis hominis TaxID=12968 RepID=D8M992_BLAHO|nr:uncharacterized protein [Blastocystis hominis]CBK24631.2 unnamed protein product [Blastocystis hominis]|eukprot:XP_012898679.1 uncharacterized protein [Blastocystis hominis]
MIDSLFVLGEDKQIVIEKHWKQTIDRSVLEPYFAALAKYVDSNNIPPVLESGECALIVVKENNLSFIAVVKSECSPLLIVDFITQIISVLKTYIGTVNEVKIRGNFSIVYQLLDEVSDFGIPVITEPSIMSSIIKIPTVINKVSALVTKVANLNTEDTWLPGSTNNAVSWRRPDLSYMRNEIRISIIEFLNATVTSKGSLTSCSAYGVLRVDSHLSQSPEVALTLQNSNSIEALRVHRCVDRARLRSSQTLQFVPLDGVFDVATYAVKRVDNAALDFYCRPNLSWTRGEGGVWGTLEVTLGCKPGKRGKQEGNPVMVQAVTVEIVLPPTTSGANLTTSAGKMMFDQEEKKLLWVAGNLRREDVLTLRGPVYLQPGSAVPKSSICAKVGFVQPEGNVSGLGVGKINVQRTKGEYNWTSSVSRILQSGSYDVQM